MSGEQKHAVDEVYKVPERVSEGALVSSLDQYRTLYAESIADRNAFWAKQARTLLKWDRDFDTVSSLGDIAWFLNGKLNVSVNCLDRHVATHPDKTAIIWEADEPGQSKHVTYRQALHDTCRIANMLKHWGVRKGDTVAIYMPMIPELAFTMLACARIGAVHSVVFAGFSATALKQRIVDAKSKWVVTADQGLRGGRPIQLKQIVNEAVAGTCAERVFMFRRTHVDIALHDIDVDVEVELPKFRGYCPAESMDSEDTLFLLYTSGSTGLPKGVAHTTAGYLLYTTMTHRYVFDVRPDDVYACVADCGWITGHSYIVYGPLSNGATTLMFESIPTYPNNSRYWDLIQRHKVTQFYTAPTAIRALMRFGTEPFEGYDLSSLRVLGSVGEPINPEAWRWYHTNVGKGNCSIVDTYWQTETGGIVLTPLPGATPQKPGSGSLPFFGIEFVVVDPQTGSIISGNDVSGVLCIRNPWPSIARTVYGSHDRYLTVYMKPYRGLYFTGDGCYRDKDGYLWITGRVDDVLNVSGHRIGTAEIESALVGHAYCSEAAVVGCPHDIKGEGICCYVTLVHGIEESASVLSSLREAVRTAIGAIATPDFIIITPALPKTRSGKIMRRLLRKIIAHETDSLGDISTLADSSVVEALIAKVNTLHPKHH